MKIGSLDSVEIRLVLVEFVTPVPNKADATEAEVRAPKANAMLGCMAALDNSD